MCAKGWYCLLPVPERGVLQLQGRREAVSKYKAVVLTSLQQLLASGFGEEAAEVLPLLMQSGVAEIAFPWREWPGSFPCRTGVLLDAELGNAQSSA